MADSIILLEERKEVTTFLLDEGTITATTVTTPTGETPGYEYSGDKIKVDDIIVKYSLTMAEEANSLFTHGTSKSLKMVLNMNIR